MESSSQNAMNHSKAAPDWAPQLDAVVQEFSDTMIASRRHLHMHPELSGGELRSTAFLAEALKNVSGTLRILPESRGLLFDSPHPTEFPRIGLRADIDALPIQDQKTTPYRSQNPGIMHACGHDAHSATLLGVVLSLSAAQSRGILPGSVPFRAIFQPAEETGRGAREVIAAGGIKGVQGLLALHMDPTRRLGTVGVRAGALTASCDDFEICVIGRGGHAARPQECLDPIPAVADLIQQIYTQIPRGVDCQDPVVVTIGQVQAGDCPNVIPDRARLCGTIRTLQDSVRPRVKELMDRLVQGVSAAHGVNMDLQFDDGLGSVNNDPRLTALLRSAASNALGKENVEEIPRASMGGEDFANYLGEVPGSMFRLGCRHPDREITPLHTGQFDIDERAMAIGAKILARAAVLYCLPEGDSSRTESEA